MGKIKKYSSFGDQSGIELQTSMHKTESAVTDSLNKSRKIIEDAKRNAEKLIAKSSEKGFTNGYDEGFNSGYTQGKLDGEKEKQPVLDAIRQLSERTADAYEHSDSEEDYTNLAFELAEKIIDMEISENDEAIYSLYKKAAAHISNVDKAVLKLGPKGIEAVGADRGKFIDAIDGLTDLQTVCAGYDNGACILETSLGNIDASVSVQLKRAKEIISPQG